MSQDNLIERNNIGGNLNGVYIASPAGNVIRRNIIAGNPPVQVSESFGKSVGADIQDVSPADTDNTFEENYCLVYVGKADPAPCPNLSEGHRGHYEWDNEESSMAGRRATTPFQGAFKYASIGQNRLAFPQARLVNAVFHLNSPLLPRASGSATPNRTADTNSATVTGKVVDAACYMMHPPAATAASHNECGAACLARGVPLAIAADDGNLYFPADGNQRLKSLLNARVRASGTVVEKHEPMELKMPVGDKNEMVVRVEGGYKQIAIQTLEKLPPTKRRPT